MSVQTKTLQRKPFIPSSISVAIFPGTKACSLLDKFEREERVAPERQEIVLTGKPRAIRQLEKTFELLSKNDGYLVQEGSENNIFERKIHWRMRLGLLKYSPSDLSLFSLHYLPLLLEAKPSIHTGGILSSLIQSSKETNFEIHTLNFNKDGAPIILGYKNTKNIVVHGNLGYLSFNGMISGTVVVYGDCAAHFAPLMKGGEITVYGNVGAMLGEYMSGGTIRVYGNIDGISENRWTCNIFQYDRQIVKNGETIDTPINK